MDTHALRVTDGYKTYHRAGHEFVVFQDLDLEVQEGHIVALLGPSGCGKSTLLRIVAGLEGLTRGHVYVAGGNGHGPRVGIAFQEPLLFPWLTVAENIGLGLRYRANERARQAEPLEQVLHDFSITELASSYPDELSGGQAQRVSLARTIVTHPQVLLLDEPFGALDPRTRAALQDWLLGVQHTRGLTVVLVTHDVDEAIYLGDRVYLMSPSPGAIVGNWETVHDGRRDRDSLRASTLRREVLAHYRTDLGAQPASLGPRTNGM